MAKEIIVLRDIPGFGGYKVSEYGEVWSFKRKSPDGLRMSLRSDKDGYLIINLWNGKKYKTRKIHQLVLETWKGLRPNIKSQGCHEDGNKQNNFRGNLYWGTAKTNQIDSVYHGTHRSQKLNVFQARIIKRLCAFRTVPHDYISGIFLISRSMISSIGCGLKWRHLNV